MIASIKLEQHETSDHVKFWQITVNVMDLVSAERLLEPIQKELSNDIELCEIINEATK